MQIPGYKPPLLQKSSPLEATYTIKGVDYALKDGKIEKEIVPGSASKEVVRIFGEPVYGDLDADGDADAVMYIQQDMGGSGTFYYAAVAVNDDGNYKGTNAMFLGDRIAPQTVEIHDGRAVVNFAERAAGENFAVAPRMGKSVWIHLDVARMNIGEWVKDFEGEADPARMTLGMKKWDWISTLYNNDTTVVPKKEKAFSLTFKDNGTFSATTDCNAVGGEYTATGNKITFGKMFSTKMYCEGSQESEFTKMLNEIQSYKFTSKGELIFSLKFDSGSFIFR